MWILKRISFNDDHFYYYSSAKIVISIISSFEVGSFAVMKQVMIESLVRKDERKPNSTTSFNTHVFRQAIGPGHFLTCIYSFSFLVRTNSRREK